ncbi:MAG: hypothetical protein ACLSAH_14380 [Bilophila wadsworthia]
MNTSATGGFLQPEPGLARSDIERLIGDVIAGITGLPGISSANGSPCLRPIRKPGPRGARSASRSVPNQIAGAALRNRGRAGMSRVLTLETLTVPASFFGPACEDMALKLKAGLHISQNREPLWHANIALVQAGDVITPPASSAPGVPDDLRWSGRADLTLTFRRGPSSPQGKAAEGTVAITHAEQPDCGIRGN